MDNANISSWVVAGVLVALLAAASFVVKPDVMPQVAVQEPTRRAPIDLLPPTPSSGAQTDTPLIEH